MNDAFIVQKQQTHTNILHNLHFLVFFKPTLSQTVWIVLQIYFSIRKWHNSIITVVFSKVRADLVSHIIQKIKLILERRLHLLVIAFFLDQMVACFQIILSVYQAINCFIKTKLRNEAINSWENLCIASRINDFFLSSLFNLNGCENRIKTLPLILF